MGVLVLIISVLLSIGLLFAAMIYAAGSQFVLGGVLFVLSIVVMVVGSKFYRKIRLSKDAKFFTANTDASIIRIMHNPKREIVYLYKNGKTPLGDTPEGTMFASSVYLTYGINSGTHSIDTSYINKRSFSLKSEDQTITIDILPNKYYELRYDKDSKTYVLQEAELPNDLKRYKPFLEKE